MKVRINLCQDLEADHEAAALAEALAEADLAEVDITAALEADITAALAALIITDPTAIGAPDHFSEAGIVARTTMEEAVVSEDFWVSCCSLSFLCL